MSGQSVRRAIVKVNLLILWLALFVRTGSCGELIGVSLPNGVGDWVIHEESGRVFASLTDADEVVEYDSAGKEVRRLKVPAQPEEMLVKGERLIVGCKKTPALHVIDLTTNQSLGSISLTGKGPYGLFCSHVDNGFVYAICNTGDAWWDGEVLQCDLRTLKVRKQQRVQGWGQSHPLHVAMSRDGKYIVPDARGQSSPSGADLMKVDEEQCTFQQLRDYHDSFEQIAAAPQNRHWTFGNALYTLDIAKSIREFAGSPVAIHPRLDLAVSRTASGLSLQRFSDAEPIATVVIKGAEREPNRRRREAPAASIDPVIGFDLKNNRVFCGEHVSGVWVDLNDYQADLAPLCMLQTPVEVTSLVHKPLRIPLPTTNGGKDTKISLVNAPKGARVEKEHFVWQPGAEDVGISTVRLELKSTKDDRALDAVDLIVHITLPKIELGFRSRSMELSPNGRYLLAWGAAPVDQQRHPAHSGPDEIAIIDLQEAKILARKPLPQGLRCATIDDDFVFIAPNSGNLIYRLNRSLADSQRVFLQSPPVRLVKLGKQRLAALGEQSEFIDTNTMKQVEMAPYAGNRHYADPGYDLHESEVAIGERVFNRATGELVRDARMANLPLLFSNDRGNNFRVFERPPPTRWGRRLYGGSLTNCDNSSISDFAGERSGIISERWPMAILVGRSRGEGVTTTTLELANLVDGKIEHSAIIDVSAERDRDDPYGPSRQMLLAGDLLVLLKGEEILLIALPEAVAKAMPTPTYFLPQPTKELEVGAAAKVELAMGGKTDGVSLALLTEYPGVNLEAKTRTLTIDTTALWNAYLKRLAAGDNDDRYDSLTDRVGEFAENAKQYKQSVGKELGKDKFATQLPITAVLHDAEGQTDRVHFRVVVVGSRKQVDDAVTARESEEEKELAATREAFKKQQEALAKAAAARRPMADQSKQAPDVRFDALEARMRRIEAAVDSILKKLEDR